MDAGRNVLALPEFRRLWLVGLAVSVARWLEMLVVGVVVFQATGSALLVAAMTLLRLAPMGLFGMLVAVLAERLPRRISLRFILALQATAVGTMAVLAAMDALEVWQVAVACFVGGLGWATDNPVRRMMVGEAVGAARMGPAMSLDVLGNNASRVSGPALGGALLAAFGPHAAFCLSLLLYLVAIAIAWRIGVGATVGESRGEPILRGMRDSVGLAARNERLRAVLVVTVVFNLFAWPCTSMIPVIGQAGLGLGASAIGVLASMEGVGALAGAALIGALARPGIYPAIYVAGTALYLAAMVAFALAPGAVPAGAALLVSGIAGAGFATMQATLSYLAVPPEARGRALGALSTAIGTGPLGFLQIGLLAEWLGAGPATVLVGLQGLLALALTWPLWRVVFTEARA
ncbi:MFS transporter [Falsiroseomonas oryziterrae]|uniref:MFS transporter n=1 Tax=Falsiroseomonas oryziterrae TaxID=2911368 RepID=UPI001F2861FF|nr:MFS transporter [Roseomonas sp. NPKOSM-4]